jgi:cytidine deaminase
VEPSNEPRIARLRDAASMAGSACYPRYSGLVVLAAVERIDGKVYGGANVEVVNFSLSKHAEEAATLAAIADGALQLGDHWLAAVYTLGSPPCGSCRQFLWEWASPDARCFIDGSSTGDGIQDLALTDLLPEPFDPSMLPDRRA